MRQLIVLALLPAIAAAQPSSKPKAGPVGSAPQFELTAAVAKARTYASANTLDLTKQYLQSASFDPVAREWEVVWQKPNAKGGSTAFHVKETGTISVTNGE